MIFEHNPQEKKFLRACLEEFQLDQKDWNNFELVNLNLNCKIKTSKHFRQDN